MIPGAILQNAVMAALRAKGLTVTDFARHAKTSTGNVRYCVFGVSSGGRGSQLRDDLIDYAGRGLVLQIYASRMVSEAEKLREWAA
ncbi:hypothetical protein JI58_05290 [Marinosulfonomonas sp. PRT-SC04]|nr:hypothetical protein JI58_05290 [Marinosulfonomonas sp. PRT-SC04]